MKKQNDNPTTMCFCEKCGTKVLNETDLCPQCGASIPGDTYRSKKINKMIIIIPLVVIVTALISIGTMYYLNKTHPAKNVSKNKVNSISSNVCPANKYGNHDWRAATCIRPAKCYNCGAYKDDQLSTNHDWTDEGSKRHCFDCNLLYDEYIEDYSNNDPINQTVEVVTTKDSNVCPASDYGNHNWKPATCIEPSKCRNCDAYKDDKVASHHNWYDYDSGRKCCDCNLSYDDYIYD